MTNERHEKALEAAEQEWIEWAGGECPVPVGTIVDVKTRDGDFGTFLKAGTPEYLECSEGGSMAEEWDHTNVPGDIIAYRIVSTQHFTNGE